MDRKKSFQMKQRFDRCKTPMGSVPISVIMGFDYPLDSTTEIGGRGELNSRSSYKSNYSLPQSNHFNTNYMNVNMLERIPRSNQSSTLTSWPSGMSSSRASSRARTEVREVSNYNIPASNYNGYTTSFSIEHPKQQPCRYASALSMTAISSTTPRSVRSSTVMPSSNTTSVWRNNSSYYSSNRPTFSSYAEKFSSPANSYRFSGVRSRFS